MGTLKRKAKDLEAQVQDKDLEIAKMREKTSDKAQEGMKDELRRAYDVLRHLKKKVGPHAFNEEYGIVMTEIRNALNMPQPEKRSKRRVIKAAPLKAVKEPVHIESDDASADELVAKGKQNMASEDDEEDEDGTKMN